MVLGVTIFVLGILGFILNSLFLVAFIVKAKKETSLVHITSRRNIEPKTMMMRGYDDNNLKLPQSRQAYLKDVRYNDEE